MSVATFKYDMPNGGITPAQEGRTAVTYPFLPNGSIGPKVYTRRLLQQEAYYVPATMGMERDSVWNGGDPMAYLISETSPEHTGIGDMLRFSRSYARIPAQQTAYSSRVIQRPIMHGIKSGSSYAVSFDNGVTSHVWTSRKAITHVASVAAATTVAVMPSSNIVFVEGGRTLNLAANSSAAATVTAFNTTLTGLTNVAANASTGFLSIVWTGPMTSITPPSGVVIAALSLTWTVTFRSIGTNTSPATTLFTASSHGAAVGDRVALWAGDSLLGTGTVVSIGDANNFSVMTNELSAADTLVTHCAFSSGASARYVNGHANVSTKEVTDFYLPGVSSGITTVADIPLVATKLDPVSWLGEIVAASAFAVVEGSQLSRWLDGPIYSQTTISAQMSDALDTVAVGA